MDTIVDDGNNNASDAVVFYSTAFSQLSFSRTNSNHDIQITAVSSQGYTGSLCLENAGLYMDTNSYAPREQVPSPMISRSVWLSALQGMTVWSAHRWRTTSWETPETIP